MFCVGISKGNCSKNEVEMNKKIAKGLSLLAAAVIAMGVVPTSVFAAPVANDVDWAVSLGKII